MTIKQEQRVADRDERLAKAKSDSKYVIKSYMEQMEKYKKERESYLVRVTLSDDSKTIKYLMQKVEHTNNNIIICQKQIEIQELKQQIDKRRDENFQRKIGLISM